MAERFEGDYPGAEPPQEQLRCPRCGRLWQGWHVGEQTEWSCVQDTGPYAQDILADSEDAPVRGGLCRACAWERRTAREIARYVSCEVPSSRLLAYALCADERTALCEPVCDVLIGALRKAEPQYARELEDDYVSDCRREDFIDLVLGSGEDSRAGQGRKEEEAWRKKEDA